MTRILTDQGRRPGTLSRLRRDHTGNTLAMMAMAIIPLAGLVGGAMDMSRLYLTKTRMQQACDAGALAGRKIMGGGTWAYDNYAAKKAADEFFNGNMREGDYGTVDLDHAYEEKAGKVTGKASAKVPMTLMKVFKQDTQTIDVTCATEMRLPNTDVMFVLDITGSMDQTLAGDSQNKMSGLKVAVKCFYEIVARLDSDAECEGGAPSGGTGSQVQVRFGFVPYSTNVNVGYLLPSNWFKDAHTYQSREQATWFGEVYESEQGSTSNGSWREYEVTIQPNKTSCESRVPANTPAAKSGEPTLVDKSWTDTTWRGVQRYTYDNFTYSYNTTSDRCVISIRERRYNQTNKYRKVDAGTPGADPFKVWRYRPVQVDLTPLKNGSSWNSTITLPTGAKYTDQTITWDGCIEERRTVYKNSYSPIESIKAETIDLDIDRLPDGNVDTQWAPALGQIIYPRKQTYDNGSAWVMEERETFSGYSGAAYACGTEAKKLQKWTEASAFDTYVNSLEPTSNTYHDIGLLWGARLMSPTGLFRSENQFTPQGGEIERHMIFMTDGDACTENYNYAAYGMEWYDRRRVDADTIPTDGCTTTGTITKQVNARTAALCEAVKNKNITLWVIWFGEKNTYIENTMKSCSSANRFFSARNSAELQRTFRQIANQISQLRLTV